LLLAGTVFLFASIRVLTRTFEPIVIANAASFLLAAAAFGLIAVHLRSLGHRVAAAAAAWVVSAAFVVLAVVNFLYFGDMGYSLFEFVLPLAFLLLLIFGITAAITTRQRWMWWAAATGVCGSVAYAIESFHVSELFRLSWAWPAVLLVFAMYAYAAGREKPLGPLAVPGALAMSFVGLTFVWWLICFLYVGPTNWSRYPTGFFRWFDPFNCYYYAYCYFDESPSTYAFAAVLFSCACGILGKNSSSLRYNRTAVAIAWVLSVFVLLILVVLMGFDPFGPTILNVLAMVVFVLLGALGIASIVSKRSSWASYACAAGLFGAILSAYFYFKDLPGKLAATLFVAWCVLFFMFALSLYRYRRRGPVDATPPNGPVDHWAPTQQRPT
jgi:hypothetical protein